MLEPILYFSGTILATMMAAVLTCRYLVAHERPISWGTVIASSVIANSAIFVGMAFYEEGWQLFTQDAWSPPKGGWGGVVIVLSVISVLCLLPALGVAVYYQRRSKRNEACVLRSAGM